jgi:hypothetical protein
MPLKSKRLKIPNGKLQTRTRRSGIRTPDRSPYPGVSGGLV